MFSRPPAGASARPVISQRRCRASIPRVERADVPPHTARTACLYFEHTPVRGEPTSRPKRIERDSKNIYSAGRRLLPLLPSLTSRARKAYAKRTPNPPSRGSKGIVVQQTKREPFPLNRHHTRSKENRRARLLPNVSALGVRGGPRLPRTRPPPTVHVALHPFGPPTGPYMIKS